MVEGTLEACPTITGLTRRRNLSQRIVTIAFVMVTPTTAITMWRVLLLVGEDQHTRAVSTRNVEQVREIATDVGLLGIGFDSGVYRRHPPLCRR